LRSAGATALLQNIADLHANLLRSLMWILLCTTGNGDSKHFGFVGHQHTGGADEEFDECIDDNDVDKETVSDYYHILAVYWVSKCV
jgi:hypothetical protein